MVSVYDCVRLYGYICSSSMQQEFKRETRFTSTCPANEIISKIEEAAKPLGFDVQKKNYKVSQSYIRLWDHISNLLNKLCS